jgi:hypothetical protein
MTRHTATIDLDADQLELLEATAAFMGMPLQQFLDASLQSGIAHAESIFLDELDPAEHTANSSPASDMDDGIPF